METLHLIDDHLSELIYNGSDDDRYRATLRNHYGILSPLDMPRPKRSIKFDFWIRADKAFNQFCKEWKA